MTHTSKCYRESEPLLLQEDLKKDPSTESHLKAQCDFFNGTGYTTALPASSRVFQYSRSEPFAVMLASHRPDKRRSSEEIARLLHDYVISNFNKKPERVFSVLSRAKALSQDPLVQEIYKKCDYLKDLYGRTGDYANQQELRDEIWKNRKKILGVLNTKEELKIWGTAISFFPDTPWLKAMANHYATLSGLTEPDATMQFTAYFTYPQAARPQIKKDLDALMKLAEQLVTKP